MKTYLFFDPNVRGHIIEYLHHTYIYTNNTDKFIYIVSPLFKERCKTLEWPIRKNVNIIYMTEYEADICSQSNKINAAWNISRILKKYIKQEKATHVFLNYLMNAMPFILFNTPKECKVSGIIYRNYLNKEHFKYNNFQIIAEKLLYYFMAKIHKMDTILLLNDPQSANFLNKKFNSNKFKPIVDPINEVNFSILKDLRMELDIPKDNRVFLQFGSLDKRKNTLTILDAALGMSDKDLSKITLIFAGKLEKEIHDDFYRKVNILKKRTQVIIKEGFLPFEYLFSLCKTVDCLLTCYSNIEQSSGTIGYASLFETPVIGPNKGLLGKLIRDNNLGITLNNITAEEIRTAMLIPKLPKASHKYAENNTIEKFAQTIMGIFK